MKKFVLGLIAALTILAGSSAFAQGTPKIALLNSQLSSDYYRDYYPGCTSSNYMGPLEYNRYWKGWYIILKNYMPGLVENTDFEVISDAQINSVNFSTSNPVYKILILSNAVRMSPEQAQVIRRWVLAGGKLLATFGTGYEKIITHPAQLENEVRRYKSHTGGLHDLWQDPLNVMVTSFVNISDYTNIRLSKPASTVGPTQGVSNNSTTGELFYGNWSNMLVQRPLDFNNAYAFLNFYNFTPAWGTPVSYSRPAPAILSTSHGKGWVVYYSIAPEFTVTLEFPEFGVTRCPLDTGSNTGASAEMRPLMIATVHYLRNLQLKLGF